MIPQLLHDTPRIEGDEAATALSALAPGLTPTLLTDSVIAGVRSAGNITAAHPVTARGFTLWSETVAALRESLTAHRWTIADPKNSPTIVAPDGTIAIVPVRGNAATGVTVDADPATARHRGPATIDAARKNMQLVVPIDMILADLRSHEPDHRWILLYHWSPDEPVVRAELSLPILNDEQQTMPAQKLHITTWRHRILLPAVDTSDFITSKDPSTEDEVDFDIEEIS